MKRNRTNQRRPWELEKEKDLVVSRVKPGVAAVLSLIVPGLGQMVAGAGRRGLLLLGSMISTLGLLVWRIKLAGKREEEILKIFLKAIRLQPFLAVLVVMVGALWVWIIWDATQQATQGKRGGAGILILVLVIFFALGWQITEIDIYKAVTQINEAGPPLLRILWPWERAVTRQETHLSAFAEFESPCTDSPPDYPVEVDGQPYIQVEPTCGVLSKAGEPGTEVLVTGYGFAPNVQTVIWWEDPLGAEFRIWKQGEYLQVNTDGEGKFEIRFTLPIIEVPPSAGEGPFTHHVEARQIAALGPLEPSTELKLTVERMVETIFLGLMATLFGVVLAIPVSFSAARNLMSTSRFTMIIYYMSRTVLNIVRSIEPLIWALIATVWVGLGPFAGIIALTLHSVAALGKLYSEAIEGIDPGPIEAIQATGANWIQTIMFAVVPQMVPPFISFTIYRWDINVRMSTIIGAVGGGGIGFLLIQWIRLLDYRAAGIAVWFIAITVAILDYVSSEIRNRFM
ncbi:MAG: phosphonate ABC transporter, permease protein PhnE [Anaerolineales bacterium]|nr:phosphonate ABC transporter, permease protein PhnE [Anaerolineales bacterium]